MEQLEYWRTKLLPHYLATGAIIEIGLPEWNSRFISSCHLEPKSSGGFRLVVDLRLVNSHFDSRPLKYETLQVIKYALSTVQFGMSIDVSDAYHHLKLSASISKYFTFEIDNKVYQCLGLPFGWNLSPFVYTKFMRPVIEALRYPQKLKGILTNTLLYQ